MGLSPLEVPSPEPPSPSRCQDPGVPPSPFSPSSELPPPPPFSRFSFFHLRFLPSVVKIGNGSICLLLGGVLRKVYFKSRLKKKKIPPRVLHFAMSPSVRGLPSPPPPNCRSLVRRFGSVGGSVSLLRKILGQSGSGSREARGAPPPAQGRGARERRRPLPSRGNPSRSPGRAGSGRRRRRRRRRGRGAVAAGERRRRRRRARGAGRSPQLLPLPPGRSRPSHSAAEVCERYERCGAASRARLAGPRSRASRGSVGCWRRLPQGVPGWPRSRVVRCCWGTGTCGAARPSRGALQRTARAPWLGRAERNRRGEAPGPAAGARGGGAGSMGSDAQRHDDGR